MLKIVLNVFYQPIQQLKDFIEQNRDIYVPINGGASLKNDQWCQKNLLFDDIGDNISSHNKQLNENTSIYWFWKHLDEFEDADYCGFSHYRRFFHKDSIQTYKQHDILVAKSINCLYSLEWQYSYYHNSGDLTTCIKTLKKHDYQFGAAFEKYMQEQHDNFAPMNMFVMKRPFFEEWCSFIFPILFKLESVIDVSNRDNYQKRAVCFLEERIFGFWCWQKKNAHGLDVVEVPIEEHLDWKDNMLNERGSYG